MKSHANLYRHKVNDLKKFMNDTKVSDLAAFTSQEAELNFKYFSQSLSLSSLLSLTLRASRRENKIRSSSLTIHI